MGATTVDIKVTGRVNYRRADKVKAATKILGGILTMSDVTGYVIPGANTASCIFRGISNGLADNALGLDGAITVENHKKGDFLVALDSNGSFTIADIGLEVYILDNQTVAKVGQANNVKCGRLTEFISATSGYISIDGYAL